MLKLFSNKVNLKPLFGVVYIWYGIHCIPNTLVYICFHIFMDWRKFHTELTFSKTIFCKNGYLENFIDKCFKTFLSNTQRIK